MENCLKKGGGGLEKKRVPQEIYKHNLQAQRSAIVYEEITGTVNQSDELPIIPNLTPDKQVIN
jgi:hypothetical protein